MVHEWPRVGYVVKRYPRYSETFIVSELLAHEAAGLDIEIFSLYPPNDTHFQAGLAEVRAPVHYIAGSNLRFTELWGALEGIGDELPHAWSMLAGARGEDPHDVYQAVLLARAVRRSGIGHLHAHFGSCATAVTRLAAGMAGVSYSCTLHAKDIYHESVQPAQLRLRIADAAAAITVSDYNLGILRERYGRVAGRVRRVYNGLDLDRFRYSAPADRPPRLLAVGRLVEKKGFGDLVEACAILRERGRGFDCRIIGGGPLEPELRARIERLGLTARVELAGPRPQADVIAHIRGSAALAAPCVVGGDGDRDGLPTVLLEAMALGTPCVSTDVTGIPEILRHEETGLMVPQREPRALADALDRLLGDAQLRVRLAAAARRLIESEFDVRQNAAAVRETFRPAHRAHTPTVSAAS